MALCEGLEGDVLEGDVLEGDVWCTLEAECFCNLK